MSIHRFTLYFLVFSVLFVSVHASVAVSFSDYIPVLYLMNSLAPLISLGVLCFVVLKQTGASKRLWLIIAIAVASEMIAQTIWGSYDLLWSAEAPDIGIADVFWISTSLLYLTALYVWLESSGGKIRHLFDSAILLVSLSVISWECLVEPAYYEQTGLNFSTLSVDLIYPATSLLMVFTMVVWFLNGERRLSGQALAALTAGFLCYVTGDTLYVYLIDVLHLDTLETWIDPFWSSASFCFATAGLLSLKQASRSIAIVESRAGQIIRFSVPYLGLLPLVGILLSGQQVHYPFVAGLAITIVMILIRQIVFLLEREKLLDKLKQALERSEYLANYDSLTGLLNRRLFEQYLIEKLSSVKGDQVRLAVLFFDLDKFKAVNDRYGHYIGDLLLQAVAARMIPLQREGVCCARLGGDEFAVCIFSPGEIGKMEEIASTIVRDLSEPYELEGIIIRTSPSIGIAVFPEHAQRVPDLIKKADQAMYLAKRAGGGRFSYYSPLIK